LHAKLREARDAVAEVLDLRTENSAAGVRRIPSPPLCNSSRIQPGRAGGTGIELILEIAIAIGDQRQSHTASPPIMKTHP
jgi:hypothetical protein